MFRILFHFFLHFLSPRDHFYSSWDTFRSSFSTSLLVINSVFVHIEMDLFYPCSWEQVEFSRRYRDETLGTRCLLGNSISEGNGSGNRVGQRRKLTSPAFRKASASLVENCFGANDIQGVSCWAKGQAFSGHLTLTHCTQPQKGHDLR